MGASLAVALIPAAAFFLHDFVFQLPDNQHEASLGFFLTLAGLLFVWGLAGYLAARGRTHRVIWGATAGVVSVLMIGVTFFVLNWFFVDRMSYEPDRIRAFHASGARTMWEFVNGRGFDPGPGPILMVLAALAGAAGSGLRRTAPALRRR
jgi:hypothetical protein